MDMEIKEAVEILQYVVETEDEKAALISLVESAQKGEMADKVSSKQVYFIEKMLAAGETDYEEFRSTFEQELPEDPRQLPKKLGSKVITELINRGYKDKLG